VNGLEKEFSGTVEFRTIDTTRYETFQKYQKEYQLQAMPTVVVIDANGKKILTETGVGDEASYRKKLTEALEKAGG